MRLSMRGRPTWTAWPRRCTTSGSGARRGQRGRARPARARPETPPACTDPQEGSVRSTAADAGGSARCDAPDRAPAIAVAPGGGCAGKLRPRHRARPAPPRPGSSPPGASVLARADKGGGQAARRERGWRPASECKAQVRAACLASAHNRARMPPCAEESPEGRGCRAAWMLELPSGQSPATFARIRRPQAPPSSPRGMQGMLPSTSSVEWRGGSAAMQGHAKGLGRRRGRDAPSGQARGRGPSH